MTRSGCTGVDGRVEPGHDGGGALKDEDGFFYARFGKRSQPLSTSRHDRACPGYQPVW
jgi:hypothetical protein